MKTKIGLLLAAALLIFSFCFSQSDAKHKPVYYAIIVRQNGHDAKMILFDVTDSSVVLMNRKDSSMHSVSYRYIEKIKVRGKGTTGIAITIGSLTGFFIGFVVGSATAPAPSIGWSSSVSSEWPAAGAAMGLGLGLIAGTIIGELAHKVIKVNHDAATFTKAANKLKIYCQR